MQLAPPDGTTTVAAGQAPLISLDGLPDLLTVPEVAVALRASRNWVYDAIRQGLFRAVRIGRSLRVPRREVERFIAAGGSAAAPGP